MLLYKIRPIDQSSGVIITASVNLMNSSFRSIASRAPRNVVGDIYSTPLFDPVRKLQDGSLESKLLFVDLEQQGRVQVRVWHNDSSVDLLKA